ncbi:MAG: tetratricopeptide repeat protein [Bacteroidales bacterium]|nr:tetratricopeptide repeat protein [Bacteroidales bacterium]
MCRCLKSTIGLAFFCQLFLLFIQFSNAIAQTADPANLLAKGDTTLVVGLFRRGNSFFDGPSDSLIFYYDSALSLIRSGIQKIPVGDRNYGFSNYKVIKRLERDANIQLGIENLLQGNYKESLRYYNSSLKISEEMNDVSAISECYGEIGTLYNNQGNYDLALEYQQKALEIARQMNDEDWIAICNNNIGNVYKKKAFYSLSLRHYLHALEWFETSSQSRRIAACYQNIGDVNFSQNNLGKALDYYQRALGIAIESGNRQREADSYLLIGLVHEKQQNQMLAKEFLAKSLNLYKELGYRHGKDDCYIALGNTWLSEKNWIKAEESYHQAFEIATAGNDKASIAEVKIKLGLVYLKQQLFSRALEMLQQGLQEAVEIGSVELQIQANRLLTHFYEETGNTALALQHFRHYAALKDSLFSDSQYRIISEMEAIYEASKKEQNIELLSERNRVQELIISRRNRLLILTGLFFLISLLIGYLYIAYSKLKSAQRSVELENRLLRSQMNPHFIFNSLIAIQSYFYEHNPEKASDFLAKFADLIRMTLVNSRAEFVVLEKELEMICIYLELQSLRFNNKFIFNITVDENIEAANIRIPPMLAQPFIENAVEHGLRNKKEQGRLSIGFSKNGKSLMVSVEDNGIGREASKHFRKSTEHLSLAVPMINERLGIMSTKFRNKFVMKITDLYDPDGNPAGTRVEITMPWQA